MLQMYTYLHHRKGEIIEVLGNQNLCFRSIRMKMQSYLSLEDVENSENKMESRVIKRISIAKFHSIKLRMKITKEKHTMHFAHLQHRIKKGENILFPIATF